MVHMTLHQPDRKLLRHSNQAAPVSHIFPGKHCLLLGCPSNSQEVQKGSLSIALSPGPVKILVGDSSDSGEASATLI